MTHPDLLAKFNVNEGQALRYFSPEELPKLKISPHLKEVLLHYFSGDVIPRPNEAQAVT